ncbi:MAG: YcaO-like family protein, partial [Alphaproteobacteria bacterium]|nr:YcaO-like family protein [Alphaproteobacteria bacterium]
MVEDIVRQDAAKGAVADPAGIKGHRRGTHRTMAPAQTLAQTRPHMAAMGITRIANVTGLDRIGIPVVMVMRPNARSIAVSQGKGLDLDAAKASGLMEAVEAFHAERISLPLKLAGAEELSADHPLVDVDRLPKVVGGRFTPSLPLLWIEGRELMADRPVWLPYEMVHANYTLPPPTGAGCFPATTNGLASGNHLFEAICHGLAEVIERDATALWTRRDLHDQRRGRLGLDTVDDPDCRAVLERIGAADLRPAVWETTTDVGVPAFFCALADDRPGSHLGVGAGCHPARAIALVRALTEAVQVRTTYITGARDDLLPAQYSQAGRDERSRQAARLMAAAGGERAFGDGPDQANDTFEG